MTAWLSVFLGGGLGAALRYAVLKMTAPWQGSGSFPWGILFINVSGSLLLGACLGLTTSDSKTQTWWLFWVTGILGGYTTFSTFSGDTLTLLQQQRVFAALLNALGSPLLGVLFAFLGWALIMKLKAGTP